MAQRLNWLVGIVAIVVASVAISTTVTLWLVREGEKVERAELKTVVDDAAKQLRRVVYPNATADHAQREAERALAVAAVQRGVAEHRIEIGSRPVDAAGSELARHYFTVTDKDGGNAVCLALNEQEKTSTRADAPTVYEPTTSGEACPHRDKDTATDPDEGTS